jgi:hypothetical protein
MSTIRGQILRDAIGLTEGDRNATYGDPVKNLTCYAQLVTAYINGLQIDQADLDAVDGAILMALAKISRIAVNKGHRDNYTDLSAYAGIAGECAERLAKASEPPVAAFSTEKLRRLIAEGKTDRPIAIKCPGCGVTEMLQLGQSYLCPSCGKYMLKAF